MDSKSPDFSLEAHAALQGLLEQLGSDLRGVSQVGFTGEEPRLATPHRLAVAAAAAIAAAAAGAAGRWAGAGGPRQTLSVDALQALCALNPGYFQRQQGYRIPSSSLGRELKSSFFRTADGRWFYPVGSYPHLRDGVLTFLDCANNQEALSAAVARWKADDIESAFAARGLPGCHARTREEWLAHPQGALLASSPVITIEKIADGAPIPPQPRMRPLDDLRVLDMAHVIAGPVAARSLAEHGAEVLRISSPIQPDPVNQVMDTSIGKRNAFLDLERPHDQERLRALAAEADVFVQSWTTGSMERRGFGPHDVARLGRGVVYLSVSAFGSDGPWAERRGFDQLGQIASGLAATEGAHAGTGPRMAPTYLLNDYLSAYLGAAGVLAALERRALEGGSYHVKVSLARTSMWVQDLGLAALPATPCKLDELRPILRSRPSPFGQLDQMEPVAQLSATPAYWTLPSSPLGSGIPAWLGS